MIDQRGPHVQLTTFWRSLRTPLGNLRPVFFYTRADGAIVYQQAELPLELYWRPTTEWQSGILYKLTSPELRVSTLEETLLAVVPAAPKQVWLNKPNTAGFLTLELTSILIEPWQAVAVQVPRIRRSNLVM